MHSDPPDPDRPVLPWRLVAGALLHVAVPAYLIVLAAAWLAGWTAGGPLVFVGRTSGAFVAGFAALILLASACAALLDPPLRRRRARRERTDPAAPARRAAAQVARSVRQLEAIGGVPLVAAAARLRAARWDFADERGQGIAADLARAVDAFAAAHASAAPDRRGQVARDAAGALDIVIAAVADLADERARLDEGDARTHAAYLGRRYAVFPVDPAGPDRG